ncbi:MAG: RNA 3'-phosphate cyclase [Thaumarchaeota archaeon]|nr:RNA 3'-phosphate cyclase [Nitrososphaerota archaeon]
MDVLKIDGSHGEGGGQILRSALTLSCITQKPIQIENIRHNRKVPGLRPSHLSTIKLLGKICNAKIDGLNVGSTSITFFPGEIQDAKLQENVGTAGSISLILQAIIPTVSLAKKKLELTVSGGTDVPWSPTINYTKYVLSEAYSRIGIDFTVDVKKRGYYPKGGGLVDLVVLPCQKITPLHLSKRTTKNAKILCSYSDLSDNKISSSVCSIEKTLQEKGFSTESCITQQRALNQGASVLIHSIDASSINGADELLDMKNKSEFGKTATSAFIECDFGADANLSDMLVLPLSLTKEMSIFTVKEISLHLETSLYITSKITGCKYGVGKIDGGFEVRIQGSDSSI